MNISGKRILIITDSISMPRTGIPYEDTWICGFKKEFSNCDIIDRPVRGSTTSRLVLEGGGGIDLLELYSPDIVIVQMGLEECAPRLFRKTGFEHFFMTRLLPARYLKRYISFVKRKRVRLPESTELPPSVTESNIRSYLERCARLGVKTVFFRINRPNDLYVSKSPFIGENIIRFNRMLEKFAAEFDFLALADPIKAHHDINTLFVDELHVNRAGHMLYLDEIRGIINSPGFK